MDTQVLATAREVPGRALRRLRATGAPLACARSERPRRRLALVSLLLLGIFMALTAAPALAFRGHAFEKSFGNSGSGEGQFSKPSGVAVSDATGQVYVLDQGNGRVEQFSSTGVYEAQFNGIETPAKAFVFDVEDVKAGVIAVLNGGIAVDNSCYFKKLSASACSTADPSNGDVYVTDPGNDVVDKFSPAGLYLGQLQASGGAPFEFERSLPERGVSTQGVGVDTSGTVWVYQEDHHSEGDVDGFTNAEPNTFISARPLTGGHGFDRSGFAVDSEDNLYAREESESSESFVVSKFNSSGEVLSAPFEAEETSAVAVDLASDEVFLDNVGSVGGFSVAGSLQERFGSGHLTSGSGLAVSHEKNTANTTVYVVDSVADVVDVFPPEPPGPPTVVGESVSKVTANSATFQAEVNPRGASTEYHFEYGPCATPATCASSAYEKSVPVPDAFVGADFEVHSVSVHPQDLLAGMVYHFRVVAENAISKKEGKPAEGKEETFTTQTVGGFVLPDGRQWEMVSPPEKLGALIEPIGGFGLVQASADGEAITYVTTSPTESESQGSAVRVQALSTRGRDGWGSQDIAIPHSVATGPSIGEGVEYRFSSEDLSLGVLQPFGSFDPSLSEEASEQTAYLRTNFQSGGSGEPCLPATMHCYRPLVTGKEGFANVPESAAFGEEGQCTPLVGKLICGPVFLGATPDLSHVVLASGVPLTKTTPVAAKGGLYEWSAGKPPSEQLDLVSVLPRNKEGEEKPASEPRLGYRNADARHAISDDGSRIVWESLTEKHLYMRDTVLGESVQLDAVQGGEGSNKAKPVFQGASSDGSKVFFTDNQRLTKGSGAGNGEGQGDLYECEMAEVAGKLQCGLSDLTPVSSGESADVLGAVIGSSEDGSYVYFVANGSQEEDPGAVHHGNCAAQFAPRGAMCNLYVRHDGATKLVAVLSGEDSPDWAKGEPENLQYLTARVSPDGRWLAFMSQRSLTGYDNRDAVSGKPDEEVYLYDATQPVSPTNPVCASCNPTGARPVGVEVGTEQRIVDSAGGGNPDWLSTTWLAANIPGWTPYTPALSRYQSRYLSDSGRLFFNSNDALVPQDTNSTWDVYEYEPPGVGDCTSSGPVFGRASGGCVGLISSGVSREESAFLDASATGGDVFFLTAAKLSLEDTDTALDVYDAHECTVSVPCFPPSPPPPPACEGDACQSPVQAPNDPTPGSLTYQGPGNVVPLVSVFVKSKTVAQLRAEKLAKALRVCKKDKSKSKRVKCEKQARRQFGVAKKAKKSSNKRRAQS